MPLNGNLSSVTSYLEKVKKFFHEQGIDDKIALADDAIHLITTKNTSIIAAEIEQLLQPIFAIHKTIFENELSGYYDAYQKNHSQLFFAMIQQTVDKSLNETNVRTLDNLHTKNKEIFDIWLTYSRIQKQLNDLPDAIVPLGKSLDETHVNLKLWASGYEVFLRCKQMSPPGVTANMVDLVIRFRNIHRPFLPLTVKSTTQTNDDGQVVKPRVI